MFFIIGMNQGRKQLDFDQTIDCLCCGRIGHIYAFMTYTYLSLFFIPLIKWGKRYYLTMGCCGETVEIDQELGADIEWGDVSRLSDKVIAKYFRSNSRSGSGSYSQPKIVYSIPRRCSRCGYETDEGYNYCPHCGAKL